MELTQTTPAPSPQARTLEVSPRTARRRRGVVVVLVTVLIMGLAATAAWVYPSVQRAYAAPQPTRVAGEVVKVAPATSTMVNADPQLLIDRDHIPPGTRFRVALPRGLSAVALAITQRDPTAAGPLTIDSGAGPSQVPGFDSAAGSTNLTVTVPVRGDIMTLVSGAGGHLVVSLVGSFQPSAETRAGRFVSIAPVQVATLETSTDGRFTSVPVQAYGARPGTRAALIQVHATIGSRNEASVEINPGATGADQIMRWAPDSTGDPARQASALVRVGSDGKFTVHYLHGAEISITVLGYVTGGQAASSASGLLKPSTVAVPFGGQFT